MSNSTTSTAPHGKMRALSARLKEMARDLGPDAKLPTVQSLRRELNVSVATLDSALTQLEAEKFIYRKHGVGIFVSPRMDEKCVGLVVAPEFFRAGTSPFWQELIDGTQARAAAKGELSRFYLAVPGRDGSPVNDDLAEDVRTRRLHGVLFIGYNPDAARWLESTGMPLVSFAGRSSISVKLDYAMAIELGTRELKSRGCRRLALLSPYDATLGKYKLPQLSYQARSFVPTLEAHNLRFEPELLADAAYWDAVPETRQEQGFEAINRLFAGAHAPRPEALLVIDDMMMRGALVAMHKLGMAVGQDVQVATHMNRGSNVLQGYEEDMILLEFDPAEIVSALFQALEPMMDGEPPSPREILVNPTLRV